MQLKTNLPREDSRGGFFIGEDSACIRSDFCAQAAAYAESSAVPFYRLAAAPAAAAAWVTATAVITAAAAVLAVATVRKEQDYDDDKYQKTVVAASAKAVHPISSFQI